MLSKYLSFICNLCLACLNLIMYLMHFISPKTKNMDNGEKTEIS